MKKSLSAFALLAALSGCGLSADETGPQTPQTAATQAAPATVRTREEAADYYLRLSESFNAAIKKCMKATHPARQLLIEEGLLPDD